jgi:hypothetical protein
LFLFFFSVFRSVGGVFLGCFALFWAWKNEGKKMQKEHFKKQYFKKQQGEIRRKKDEILMKIFKIGEKIHAVDPPCSVIEGYFRGIWHCLGRG